MFTDVIHKYNLYSLHMYRIFNIKTDLRSKYLVIVVTI